MKLPQFEFWNEFSEQLSEKQQQQLYKYYQLIHEYNKVMNLTGIDDLEGVYLKHFYDSLTICEFITDEDKSIADVGTGAGFPGIVLAIRYPEKNFHLIEPLTKRIKFLQVVVDELQLNNVTLVNERMEDLDMQFDLITARAVAKLNVLLELIIPSLKVNGTFIALKGPQVTTELQEAKNALDILNSEVVKTSQITLPIENSKRYNLVIKKMKKTAKIYPRHYGKIKKNPL